jgi:hypothetical protein
MEVEQKRDFVFNFSDGTTLKLPVDSLLTDAGLYVFELELEDKLIYFSRSSVRSIEVSPATPILPKAQVESRCEQGCLVQ